MADRLSSAASGPDAISGISKFLQFRKYRKPAAKVAFARHFLYCMSYYILHRMRQTEAGI